MSSSPTGATAATTGSDQSIARDAIGGAVAGAAAYLLGYLTVYLTQSGRIEEGLSGLNFLAELFGGDPISAWQVSGWLFYNAHFVETASPGLLGGTESRNLLMQADGGSFLFVVPPLLLLVAGVVAGRVAGARTPAEGARSGALVAAGYLPLAVVGTFLFRYAVTGGGSVAPDMVTAALLAGAVYPAAFGAIGGTASSLLSG
ncbi:transporter [Halorubrum sp. 2020YC2]|uniref:transporter n=1 Tax=Halorubrum sp. 2020YC2 TaxID=2836432 RepID=UPI001BEC7AB4|nr:transporter [Halorubrum sp. 2020YC2]QWC18105.1 transporter [Halorubrum sp. 2020YC2]